MKRRLIFILVVLMLLIGIGIAVVFMGTGIYDPNNLILGNNSTTSTYEKGKLNNIEFKNLEAGVDKVLEENKDIISNYFYKNHYEKLGIIFTQEEWKQGKTVSYSITGYEFIANDNGTYRYVGLRTSHFAGEFISSEYDWETTVRADISNSTKKGYNRYVKPREIYGVLPAWGVSDDERVKTMTIDGQSADKVIEFTANDKTYYFWFIEDLKTQNDATNMDIKE